MASTTPLSAPAGPFRILLALVLLMTPAAPLAAQDTRSLEHYQQRMQAWFERLDRNRDGRLTPEESRGQVFLETNFQRLDRERRGYLVPADLGPHQRAFLGVRLRTVFSQADRNGDGRLNRREARSFPWLNRRFAEIDLDGDGTVTLEELWESRRSLAPRP
jgi:hypothetical protein